MGCIIYPFPQSFLQFLTSPQEQIVVFSTMFLVELDLKIGLRHNDVAEDLIKKGKKGTACFLVIARIHKSKSNTFESTSKREINF